MTIHKKTPHTETSVESQGLEYLCSTAGPPRKRPEGFPEGLPEVLFLMSLRLSLCVFFRHFSYSVHPRKPPEGSRKMPRKQVWHVFQLSLQGLFFNG